MNKVVTDLKAAREIPDDPLELLRRPFAANQISKLPKETGKQADERKTNMSMGVKCQLCGNWHHKNAVHLDYVGHAALTDRLLDADPHWTWEPMGFAPDGTPAFDRSGGLWIKLTVCGVTRLGYGSADGKQGGDAVKEIIGDALRNAAMRFGAALDLWHKGDLHADTEDPVPSMADKAITLLRGASADKGLFKEAWEKNFPAWKAAMDKADYARVVKVMHEIAASFPKDEPPPPPPPAEDFGIGDDEIPF